MKPRLKPAPLTDEDLLIWDFTLRLSRLSYRLFYFSRGFDRRDADLMLRRENFRQQCVDVRAPAMKPAIWLLYLQGEFGFPAREHMG